MYKLIAFILLAPILVFLLLYEQDAHQASKSFFLVKQAIDRSVLAAVQQLDAASWSDGSPQIDSSLAEHQLMAYLSANIDRTALHIARVDVKSIAFIDATHQFPYVYRGSSADPITFQKPGVVVVCEVEYARRWRVLEPIVWNIQGAAQIVPHYPTP